MKKFFLIALTSVSLLAFPALSSAQEAGNFDAGENGARIEKLEHDLMLLQRQVSRSSGSARPGGGAANADFEVRLSAIEDQMRGLQGKIEENEFKNKKLAENLEKLQRDVDFRFGELVKQQTVQPPAPAAATSEKIPAKNEKAAPAAKDASKEKSVGKTVDTAEEDAAPQTQESADTSDIQTKFSSPREHYNYAFRLLNQTQYDKAAASFEDFTKKYPKDPLIGNAYYWMGETFYIRHDYIGAADSFRQGFESMPNGSKAPDNLLKLSMSLNALKRDKEACVVLGQIITKFKKTASAVAQKAEQEKKRIGCE